MVIVNRKRMLESIITSTLPRQLLYSIEKGHAKVIVL